MASTVSTVTATEAPQSIAARKTVPTSTPHDTSVSISADQHDKFFWTYTEEPHMSRRRAIIKAHPEVRLLQPIQQPLIIR